MGPAALPLMVVGTVLQFAGQMSQAKAAKVSAQNAMTMADYKARQMDQAAGQEVAASQRAAAEEKRKYQLIASRGLAVAGASGGGVSDPTVQNLLADIEGQGAYRSSVALYQGEEAARQLKQGALTSQTEGQIAYNDGMFKSKALKGAAWSGLASNIGSIGMYQKYGGGGVKPEQMPAPVEDRFFR